MSIAAAEGPDATRAALAGAVIKARARSLLPVMVAVWIFSGGFVLIEPSPYELVFVLVLPVAIIAGLQLFRGTLNLFNLLVAFVPFAVIGAFQPRNTEVLASLIYAVVTFFLWFTAYFAANYLAEDPRRRFDGIMKSYTLVAVIVALIGTLAYLGLMPASELFLRYQRAKATFQDPNVYGPFLILPAIWAAQKVFLERGHQTLVSGVVFSVLFVGIFVSFSRGAWGSIAAATLISFMLVFLLEARAEDKARMLVIALLGAGALTMLMALLLSIDSIRDLFLQRFSVAENYDTGSTGRFGRQAYAFDLALSHPWGIGPSEFGTLRVSEDPHNTYVKVLLAYGWGGGLAFYALIGATLWRAVTRLATPSPNRLILIALFSTYVPLVIESAIIDIDHWRHFFLVTGLIWGVTTCYPRLTRKHQAMASSG